MKTLHTIIVALIVLLAQSCSQDNVETVYSKYRAFFNYNNVINTFPLRAALAPGSGQYCAIYSNGKGQMIFQTLNLDPLPVNVNAIAYYQDYINPSGSGFIVGSSNVPDPTNNSLITLCFDRACPNCFEEAGISKPLTIQENGFASCARCRRVYNLNNLGIIEQGDPGVKLFRFAVSYDGSNVLIINNKGH